MLFFFLQIYVNTYQTDCKNAKKVPCRINIVTTGMYVTLPPFRFIRKHHNYSFKKKFYFCYQIYVTTHQKRD